MSKRTARANARIESGFCSFCNRTRNLRHEEKRLGTLVRTVVTCETCRRTISSTMGLAPEPAVAKPAVAEAVPEPAAETAPEPADQGPEEPAARKAPGPRTRARRKV
jgi:hypothetical protein